MKTLPATEGSKELNGKEQIISYQQLRTFIGLIGVFLPFALWLGCLILGAGEFSVQPSISHYYYSKMHIMFVGTLWVLGGFLITYKGKPDDPWESRISNLAGCFAFGVASFPTHFEGFRLQANGTNQYLHLINPVTPFWNGFHFACAGLLFVCFIIFCFRFFQRPDKLYEQAEEIIKFNRRKRLYKVCGWGIVVSIVLLFGFYLYERVTGYDLWNYSTLCFETTSLLFFGTAWLVKGSEAWKPVFKSMITHLR